MGNKRTLSKSHLPPYLYEIKLRGKNRFQMKLRTGHRKMFPIGTTKAEAIQTALAYNEKYRSSDFELEKAEQDALARRKEKENANAVKNDPLAKPMREWIEHAMQRIINEESLKPKTLYDYRACADRIKNSELGDVLSTNLTFEHVNKYVREHYADVSNGYYNSEINRYKKFFAYLMDESVLKTNFFAMKKKKPKQVKVRKQLSFDEFLAIYELAPLFLKVAMRMSLQTTHSRAEMCNMRYKIDKAEAGSVGFIWHDKPIFVDGIKEFGKLYIHRAKVQSTKASTVVFPVTKTLNEIVKLSREDKVSCPFVVHLPPNSRYAKGVDHPLQVKPLVLTRTFERIRNKTGLWDHLSSYERPTFHEIRGLASRIFDQGGESPTARMAHNSEETTKIYTKRNDLVWNEITATFIDTDKGKLING